MAERIFDFEKEFSHESFADFERCVLQDNIALCDAKSGVLLAFTSAMVIFSLDAFTKAVGAPWLGRIGHYLTPGAFAFAAAAMLVSSAFSLSTVMPRFVRTNADDHIFWESPVFKGSAQDYVQKMRHLSIEAESNDKLVHLHTLAGVCRAKYAHLRRAMIFAASGFIILMLAEVIEA